MIDIRLSDRAQKTILRGLHALLAVIESAKKAEVKAFLSTEQANDEITFIQGGEDAPGLLTLIGGENRELFDGALKDAKTLAVERIECLDEHLVVALAELGEGLVKSEALYGLSPSQLTIFLGEAVKDIPAFSRILGPQVEGYEAVDYAHFRQGQDMALVGGGAAPELTLSRIAGSVLAQFGGFRPAVESEASTDGPADEGGPQG